MTNAWPNDAGMMTVYSYNGKHWIAVELRSISLPKYIELTAKGMLFETLTGMAGSPTPTKTWLREIKEFTHPNARPGQWYFADDPEKRKIFYYTADKPNIWVLMESLTLPEIIEGRAKGYITQSSLGNWFWLVKEHKPQHRKGKRKRYYYIGKPEKRPLICNDFPKHGLSAPPGP